MRGRRTCACTSSEALFLSSLTLPAPTLHAQVGGEEADEEEDDEIEDEGAFDSASFVPLLQAPNAKHRHVKKDRRKSDEMR